MKRSPGGGRHVLASLASAALVVSGLTAATATAQPSVDRPDEAAQIQDQVLTELAEDGSARFWVRFDARPDMSQFTHIADWDARGIAVHDALTSTADAAQADVRAELDAEGLTYQTYWITNAILVEAADESVVNDLARAPGVEGIYASFDYEEPVTRPAEPQHTFHDVEWGVHNIHADDVWAEGVTGEGMVVANIDSGVQWDHPALINQYRGWDGSTADHDYNWFDGTPDNEPAPWDWDGHGTHTMGTMVGDDGAGNQIGVAPGAQWIAASTDLTDAMMIAAGEWILAPTEIGGANPDPTQRPNVVNNSWGSELPSNDPFMEDTIEAWHAAGIFSVFSNGNSGPECGTSGSPGSRVVTYSVGSYDSWGMISGFSSRGPGEGGEIKPNISAPGGNVRSSFPGDDYGTISGTSMAAPHVSGAVALLWSADATAAGEVAATRALLDGSAIDTEDLQCGGTAEDNNVYGEGKLDAYQLVFGEAAPEMAPVITVDPTSIEGSQAPDTSTEHELTVGNDGTVDLEFSIAEVEGGGAAGTLVSPQGTDRAHASADAPDGPPAPAVVEPSAVPAVASLTEGFEDISTLPAAGWAVTNNSDPAGSTTWFQGNPSVFGAHEGEEDDYVAANFNSAGLDPGDISNWLFTPELDLVNGAELSFWTRTVENPATFVDRLQVRLSTSGDSTDVGTGFEDVGDFTTLLVEVNPEMSTTGYPGEWTEYTATIEGLAAPTSGRVAFRYYVAGGGPFGGNSNFIGIDTVSYDAGELPPLCETTDVPWLMVSPDSGTVAAGGSQAVTVGLDSTGLAAGDYTAELCVEGNDPETPVVNVPVTLTVTEPAAPVIGVDPASVEVELESGETGSSSVSVANSGDADLTFDVVEAAAGGGSCEAVDAAWLTALPTSGTVAPGGEQNVALAFDAAGLAAGDYTAELCVESNDPDTPVVMVPVTLTVTEPPEPAEVIRIAGDDRYDTAALIAEEFPEGSVTVFVANGEADAQGVDALVAGAVAAGGPEVAEDGPVPILLVKDDHLPSVASAALADLAPENIVIIGGPVAVSPAVEALLEATGAEVSRVAGDNRYETAAELTAGYPSGLDTVFVATGTGAPGASLALADALTSASVAGSQGVPVLLTQADHLPAVTVQTLTDLAPGRIVLVGGPVAVSPAVETALEAIAPTDRVFGDNRYETAVALTADYPVDTERLYVASGTNFPDALVGAALTGWQGAPLLITRPDLLPSAVAGEAQRLSPQGITIFGGPVAVNTDVEDVLQDILDMTSLD